ncbi:MAG TPA: hypothetical protein VEB19_18215 [Gemmatimonadaceae bacterium]|nr:hypothetical protein [Gemmatimonadaceae bacterium]
MSIWKRGLSSEGFATEQVPLDPPATPTELKWWAAQRDAYKRKIFLRMGFPMFGVGVLTMLLAKPEKFFSLSGLGTGFMMLLIAGFSSFVHGRSQEKNAREEAIRWKRIRQDLRLTTDRTGDMTPGQDNGQKVGS